MPLPTANHSPEDFSSKKQNIELKLINTVKINKTNFKALIILYIYTKKTIEKLNTVLRNVNLACYLDFCLIDYQYPPT